jgi:hypothetical protein
LVVADREWGTHGPTLPIAGTPGRVMPGSIFGRLLPSRPTSARAASNRIATVVRNKHRNRANP